VNVAATDRLSLAKVHNRGARDEKIALGRSQVVDLELRGHDGRTQDATARERESVVCGVAHDSAMDETMLLLQFGPDRNPDFGATFRESEQLGTEQDAEWLRREHLPPDREHVVLGRRNGHY